MNFKYVRSMEPQVVVILSPARPISMPHSRSTPPTCGGAAWSSYCPSWFCFSYHRLSHWRYSRYVDFVTFQRQLLTDCCSNTAGMLALAFSPRKMMRLRSSMPLSRNARLLMRKKTRKLKLARSRTLPELPWTQRTRLPKSKLLLG